MIKILILATAMLAASPCLAQQTVGNVPYASNDLVIYPSSHVFDETILHCKDNEKVVDHRDGTVHTFKCEAIPADPSKPDWKVQPVQHWVPSCSAGYELWFEPDLNKVGSMLVGNGFAVEEVFLDYKIDIDSTYGPGNVPPSYECRPVGSHPKEKYPRGSWTTMTRGGGGQ